MGALALALALLGLPAPQWGASACSCAMALGPLDKAAAATVVFRGWVSGIADAGDGASERVSFAVSRRWKGPATRAVLTAQQGSACGVSFQHGGEYLIYAAPPPGAAGGAAVQTNLCLGGGPISAAATDLRALGRGVAVGDQPPSPFGLAWIWPGALALAGVAMALWFWRRRQPSAPARPT